MQTPRGYCVEGRPSHPIYLVGYAVAVNHLGEEIYVSIDEVYERAEAAGWGGEIPRAAY